MFHKKYEIPKAACLKCLLCSKDATVGKKTLKTICFNSTKYIYFKMDFKIVLADLFHLRFFVLFIKNFIFIVNNFRCVRKLIMYKLVIESI